MYVQSMRSTFYLNAKQILFHYKPETLQFCGPERYINNLLDSKVSMCKYLGLIISKRNCDPDIERQMAKF